MDIKGLLQKWQDIKIKHKLIFTLSLLIIIPIVVIQYFASGIIQSRMEASQTKKIEYVKNSVSNQINEYKTKSLNYISFLRGDRSIVDAAFVAALTLDPARLASELKKHTESLDINSLEVIDPSGKVIARGHDIKRFGDNKSDKKIIKDALAGKIITDIEDENGLYSINAAGPIIRDDKPVAVVMSGIYLDNNFAKKLKDISGAEIAVDFKGKIAAATFSSDNDIKAIRKAEEHLQKVDRIEVSGTEYDITSVELKKADNSIAGEIHILVSRDEIEGAKKNMMSMLSITTLIALIVALSVGYLFSQNIANQLSKGISFARTIAQGDLRQQMEIKTRDEIGILGENLNQMAFNLKEMVDKIRMVSEGIAETTGKIDTEKLSKGTVVQGEATEVTSAAIGQMNQSIKGVVGAAESLSQSADESSASVLEMTAAINHVAQSANTLNTIVEDTSSFITEMSASIKQIDENVDVLSSSAEETAAAVSEIATTIKGIEENVNESARLSGDVKKEASELGMKAIDKTVEGMTRIMKSVEASGNIIDRLGERSQHIGKVLTVIDDVTDQTNLLALNAAIIAAQAGEHGKGFAVVADEIKDLAERTVASTKEISQMIESIQKEVGEAVISMKESSDNVVEGISLSKEAANALKKILERSDRSAQMSKEIERATKEQGRGVVQVSEEVHKITNMVRQIAHATQEQRKGSEQVMGSVEKMRDISRQVRQATIEQTKGSKQINDAVENVNQKVHAIVKATKEQSIGSEQIVTSVEKIRNITQENIKFSSEIKERIEYLIKQAELLKLEVKRFAI